MKSVFRKLRRDLGELVRGLKNYGGSKTMNSSTSKFMAKSGLDPFKNLI
jgi:hypothetical protein